MKVICVKQSPVGQPTANIAKRPHLAFYLRKEILEPAVYAITLLGHATSELSQLRSEQVNLS